MENNTSSPEERKARSLSLGVVITKKILWALLIGLCLTLLSLWVPITLKNASALDSMRFGKPFAYMTQTFSRSVPDEKFPCMVTPKFTNGYTTTLDTGMFLASLAVNSLIGGAILTALYFIRKHRKKATAAPEITVLPSADGPVSDGFAVTDDKKDKA